MATELNGHGTILLAGIVGSTAYGLADADSDVDRLGMFAAPTRAVLGLHTPRESHVTTKPTRRSTRRARRCGCFSAEIRRPPSCSG
jgi:uncharacterized protein